MTMTWVNDNSLNLIARIQSGDAAAFRDLMNRYERLVGSIVFRLVPGSEDREDLFQEIFLKVWQNLHTFRHESRLSTWIARIATNACINALNKKKVPLLEDRVPGMMDADAFPGSDPQPDSVLERSELSRYIQEEIGRLDPRYRVILTLYHLEDMSYEEIGSVLNLPPGTVKSYLHRARKQLKALITQTHRKASLWNTAI